MADLSIVATFRGGPLGGRSGVLTLAREALVLNAQLSVHGALYRIIPTSSVNTAICLDAAAGNPIPDVFGLALSFDEPLKEESSV